jgi:ADP-ribosyl-[dinitrogen reductase] hydrolase
LRLVADEHRERWARVLAPDWTPSDATESNGAVWPTLGQAVWALRHGRDFAEVLRLVIDLGGDTDTVACVAGGLAGAVFGMGGIPSRWASVVHGRVPGHGDKVWRVADLQQLAAALDGGAQQSYDPGVIPRIGPTEVLPGIWAGNLDGARYSETDFAVISLCRLGEPFPHPVHRMAYIADNEHNSDLDVVLADVLDDMAALRAEGHRLLVHCHGGASRTGLVLRAWLMRTEGMTPDEATAHVAERWPYLGLWNASFTATLERVRRNER